MRKVLISTPVYGNRVHNLYLMGAVATAAHFGKEVGFQTFAHPVISHARNVLTRRFLEHDFEYMLFIDADIGFTLEHVERVLEAGRRFERGIISGCYIRKDESLSVPAEALAIAGVGSNSFVKCALVPAGFLLVSRTSIDTMVRTFRDPWGLETGKPSEDYNFCERWRSIGGDVWLDKSIRLAHAGEKIFTVPPEEV